MRNMIVPAIATALLLNGCGTMVPKMEDFSQKLPEQLEENTIVNQVKCELHLGVQTALAQKYPNGNSADWLNQWGATVTMILTVDEKGALAPGLTFSSPFGEATQTFSMDLGASASSQATRKETISFTYTFADLMKERAISPPCSNEDGILIHSDLKIPEFIVNKVALAQIPGTIDQHAAKGYPFSTFTDQVTFVVAVSANATPGFKLVHFSVNPKASLLTASRTKTQDILITLAKAEPVKEGEAARLSPEGQAAHNAALIGLQAGQAVSDALRNLGPGPQ